ncbi:NADH dehydrogenase [ubiquinone] 1 alpha subcomplex subunit 1 [Anthophora plagiata]
MWYECLPPMIIISICMVIPEAMSPYIKQLTIGTKYVRSFDTSFNCNMLCRDKRQSNNWYKFKGLDSLPDK